MVRGSSGTGDLLGSLRQEDVALLGLGMENRALARLFVRRGIPFSVRDVRQPDDWAALRDEWGGWLRTRRFGADYLDDVARFDVLFRTPGLRPDHPALRGAVEQGARMSSQSRVFAALSPASLVGVSGTKGKGTTASLLAAMLRREGSRRVWLGGNIGVPPVSWLEEMRRDDLVILELSSFQLADWDVSPSGAILLGVGADHLDYHGTRAAYLDAKRRLVAFQRRGDWLAADADCATASSLAAASAGTPLAFSIEHEVAAGAWMEGSRLSVRLPGGTAERVCEAGDIPLRGRHNWRNVTAAVAAARFLGAGSQVIQAALREFRGLPHRLQRIACLGGVTYYDDSLATTPEAAAAAVKAFEEPVVLIAGGSSKGADFTPLARALDQSRVRAVVLIGEEAPRIAAALRSRAGIGSRIVCPGGTMEEVVAVASRCAHRGDVVLLSPACASFDMFRDYRERAEQFAAALGAAQPDGEGSNAGRA